MKSEKIGDDQGNIWQSYDVMGVKAILQEIDRQGQEVRAMKSKFLEFQKSGELEALQSRVALLEDAIEAMSSMEKPSSNIDMRKDIVVSALDPIDEKSGFYGVNYDKRGIAYRWTGPGNIFSFTLYLDRSEARTVTLSLMAFSHESNKAVNLYVNGVRTEWSEESRHDAVVDKKFVLEPVKESKRGIPTSISFEVEVMQETPSRRVGVAFHMLKAS